MSARALLFLGLCAAVFLLVRLPGVSLPLHQDEYKWPLIVNPQTSEGVSIPHPPLGEFIYREAGYVVGFDAHFRYVPLAFGLANLFLLWYWLRMRAGERAALWGAALFTLSYFSILASLMVDTDGAILPFFLLLSLVAYEKARTASAWWVGVGVALLLGFLVKASFVLAIGAIIADALWERRVLLRTRYALRIAALIAAVAVSLALVLVAAAHLFSFFDLAKSISYWEHFVSLRHNWFQVAIQSVKAIFYLSPLLVLVPLLGQREDFDKVRPLVFFVIFGLVFYLVLFDFSLGALDRYLQFLIVPLVSLAAVVLSRNLTALPGRAWAAPLQVGSVLALGIFSVQLAPQVVPSLYPKAEWIGRILSLHWGFLYPFSGGSGPLTFYISFLFIGLTWLASALLAVAGAFRSRRQGAALIVLLPLAFAYNATFAEEYLAGRINGYAPGLVERAAAFIAAEPTIARVVVYNDNGGAEIQVAGKYERRLYTSPDFDWRQKADTMNAFEGHYLVVDAPPIDPDSFFAKYFATCKPIYQDADRYMHATVYDCREAPPIVL